VVVCVCVMQSEDVFASLQIKEKYSAKTVQIYTNILVQFRDIL